MTTATPARQPQPRTPAAPRPLWERHQLFQEPDLPEGLNLEDDSDDEDGGG